MRNIVNRYTQMLASPLVFALAALLSSCGGSGLTATTTTTTTTTPTTASISLATTATAVKSDGSDTVTITATALTAGNSVVSGQSLTFSTTSGVLSAATGTTDATGKFTITFSGGTAGYNRTAVITATVTGSTVGGSIPIQISGSTLALSSSTTGVPGTAIPISITAKNAGGVVVSGQSLRYSIAATSTGSGTLSATTGTTSGSGTASVSLTGTAAGRVDVLVEWLDPAGNVSTSATQSITLSGSAAAGTFGITSPTNCPCAAAIGTPQNVVVSVPTTGVANVRFASTLGTWTGGTGTGTKVSTFVNPGTGTLTVPFNPGASAGNASVQVDALDATGAVLFTSGFIFSISAPSNTANKMTLQSNVSVLSPSVGNNLSTATLTATVLDANNNPVGGANVFFELVNSTGTGDSISPVVVTTNTTSPLGQAQATYTAGTSTTQNTSIKATVVGTAITATTPITVGATAASVSIGLSTTVAIINNNTTYQLPVTVLVSDSNGNRISGAVVSLSLWPANYYKGTRDAGCNAVLAGVFNNEDTNENLVLDAGEDIDGPGGWPGGLGTPDGVLWPAPSDAGTIPATVTTGADGTANFNWTYLKGLANWVRARIRATIQVQGSHSTTQLLTTLAPAASDISSTCGLPNSPYN